MSKLTAIIALIFLVGCTPMSNEEIIAETEKCNAAGMDARLMANAMTMLPVAVVCVPKREQSND